MKKNKVFGLIVLGMILAGLLVCLNRDILLERFWSKIESQLDYERSLKVGDDFNKISWGDLSFQIHKVGAIGIPGYRWQVKIVDDAGNEIPISRYIENENVIYLKSYSEFTGEERKVFEKMEK